MKVTKFFGLWILSVLCVLSCTDEEQGTGNTFASFWYIHFSDCFFRQPAIATGMTATSTTLGGGATLGRPLRTLPRRRTGAS